MAKYYFPNASIVEQLLYRWQFGQVIKAVDGSVHVKFYTDGEISDHCRGKGRMLTAYDVNQNLRTVIFDGSNYVIEEVAKVTGRKRVSLKSVKSPNGKWVDYRGQDYHNGMNLQSIRSNHSSEWLDSRTRWD